MKLNRIIFLVILVLPFITYSETYEAYGVSTYVSKNSISTILIQSDDYIKLQNQLNENMIFQYTNFNIPSLDSQEDLLSYIYTTKNFNLWYNYDQQIEICRYPGQANAGIFNTEGSLFVSEELIYGRQNYKVAFFDSILQAILSFTRDEDGEIVQDYTELKKAIFRKNNVYSFKTVQDGIFIVLNYPQTFANIQNSGILQNTEFIKNNSELIAQILKYNLPIISQNTTSITNLLTDQIGYVQTIYEDMFMHLNQLRTIAQNTSASTNLLKSIDSVTEFIYEGVLANKEFNYKSSKYLSTIASQYDLEAYANGSKDYTLTNNNLPLDENNPLKILHNYYRISKGQSPVYNIYPDAAWNEMGLNKIYGSFSSIDPTDLKIKQIIANQALNASKQFQQKVGNLSQVVDDDGKVTDPDTGEKVPFPQAVQEWSPDKANNALASYSYNLPSATNGLLGQVKRTLTEASDWFLLDKGTKQDTKAFQDSVIKKISTEGVKIDDSKPISVQISNSEGKPLAIEFPSEFTHNHTLRTSNESLDKLLQSFESWNGTWLTFTGLDEGISKDKGWLQLQFWQDGGYYNYMTNNFAFSLSNQLDRIISNTSLTNTGQIVSVEPGRGFYPYLINFTSTLRDPDDTGFWLDDHVYEPFSGETNYNQAVVNLLRDNFAAAANNVKANQMSFEWIRGIYYALHSNSNMLAQVHYITNDVFARCGLSLNPNHNYEEAYNSYRDTMQSEFDLINTTISEWNQQSKEKIEGITNLLFGKYLLPSKVVLFKFNGQDFTADLKKMETPIKLMHYGTTVSWLAVGLLMLPRVIYMLLNYLLRMMSKFLKLLESSSS